MQIRERYSHLNGWEYLQVHRRNLWRDVEDVIQDIDAEACRTKESKEERTKPERPCASGPFPGTAGGWLTQARTAQGNGAPRTARTARRRGSACSAGGRATVREGGARPGLSG